MVTSHREVAVIAKWYWLVGRLEVSRAFASSEYDRWGRCFYSHDTSTVARVGEVSSSRGTLAVLPNVDIYSRPRSRSYLLPNVTFYGDPYYGFYADLSSSYSQMYFSQEMLFIQLFHINCMFCSPRKISCRGLVWAVVTSESQKCRVEDMYSLRL